MDSAHPVTILLAEDDPGHSRLIEKNLRRAGLNNTIVKMSEGQQVLDYLFGGDLSEDVSDQHHLLILLDLNMPGVDGFEVLKALKRDSKLATIPVIVLTTTDDKREIAKCYELGCNAYVTKPVEYEQFAKTVQELGMFISVMSIPYEQ